MSFLAHLGRNFFLFLKLTSEVTWFGLQVFLHCFRPPFYMKQVLHQFFQIGFLSLPVVGLTAIFSGMVLALQSYTGFSRFSADGAVASVVVLSMTRELGPVLAGLMVAGRVGAAIAAEVGTMKVTEQIDALRTLSIDPYKYLVIPRVMAGVLMLPILVLIADAIGILGGYLVSTYKLGFNPANYIDQTFKILEAQDVISGLIKASVFGYIITLFGAYFGYTSKGGAQGVGSATTNAVVVSSIMILCANYILTAILFT